MQVSAQISSLKLEVKNGGNWNEYNFTKIDDYTFSILLTDETSINILNSGTFEFKINPGWTNWVGAWSGYENVTTTKCVAKNENYDSPTFKVTKDADAKKLSIFVKWVEHSTNNWQFYVTAAPYSDEYNVYFNKSLSDYSSGWENIYCFSKVNDHEFCGWPGESSSTVSGLSKCSVPTKAALIIFNNGTAGNQTGNITDIVEKGVYKYDGLYGISAAITGVGYATFSSTKAVDFTNESTIEACKASVDGNGNITYTPVTSVAKEEGVLLRNKNGISAAEAVIPLHANQNIGTNEGNQFIGITTKQKIAQSTESGYTNFVLSKVNNELAFYKVNTNGSWCGAGTAYLKVANSNIPSSREFFALENETTSIANLNVNDNANFNADAPMYNLAGQRVGKNYKGVVIVNGKKMILK